jgi:hypothetical protein
MASAAEMMLNSLFKSMGVDPKELVEKGNDLHRFSEAVVKGLNTLLEQQNMILANQKRAEEQMELTQRIAAVRALSPTGRLPDLHIEDDALFDPDFCKANGLAVVYRPEKSAIALSYKRQIAEIEAKGGDASEARSALERHIGADRALLLGNQGSGNA